MIFIFKFLFLRNPVLIYYVPIIIMFTKINIDYILYRYVALNSQ